MLKTEQVEATAFPGLELTQRDIYKMIKLRVGESVRLNRDYITQQSRSPYFFEGSGWLPARVIARYPTYVTFRLPTQNYAVSVLNVDLLFEADIMRKN